MDTWLTKYVEAARSLVAGSQPRSRFVADVSDMNTWDEAGEQFLQWLKSISIKGSGALLRRVYEADIEAARPQDAQDFKETKP